MCLFTNAVFVLHPGQILPRSGCNATPDPQIYADPNIYQLKSANKDPSKPRSELKERLSKMYFSLNGWLSLREKGSKIPSSQANIDENFANYLFKIKAENEFWNGHV